MVMGNFQVQPMPHCNLEIFHEGVCKRGNLHGFFRKEDVTGFDWHAACLVCEAMIA